MSEILFRGQTRRRGEKVLMPSGEPLPGVWVCGPGVAWGKGDHSIIYGSVIYDTDQAKMVDAEAIFNDKHIVHTDTLGRFTGLIDKNGVQIFEGDIVRHYYWPEHPEKFQIGKIYFDDDRCRFRRTAEDEPSGAEINVDCIYEVVGNIYDTPELLEATT